MPMFARMAAARAGRFTRSLLFPWHTEEVTRGVTGGLATVPPAANPFVPKRTWTLSIAAVFVLAAAALGDAAS